MHADPPAQGVKFARRNSINGPIPESRRFVVSEMAANSPTEFIAKWRANHAHERAASQEHFLDLCALLGEPTPNSDPTGAAYAFEKGATKASGGDVWADVWRRGRFAWEYKGKHKDLVAAYNQLLRYREDLENPPVLVVCDMDRFWSPRCRHRSKIAGNNIVAKMPGEEE